MLFKLSHVRHLVSRLLVSGILTGSLTAALLAFGCAKTETNQAILRLAVTTSTRDSGILDVLLPVFENQRQVRVDAIAVGTGAALKLGESGDVDVILVHARAAEAAFMAAEHGIRREDLMYNTFELLGPREDPAGIRGMGATEALQKIESRQKRFVSRGDQSGTHLRERKLWQAGGDFQAWDGYLETGQGMGMTLSIADQLGAYVLCDRGTYLNFKNKIQLVPLAAQTQELLNPYGIIVVNPKRHAKINRELAQAFVDFAISSEAQQSIRDYQVDGESLFYPLPIPHGD